MMLRATWRLSWLFLISWMPAYGRAVSQVKLGSTVRLVLSVYRQHDKWAALDVLPDLLWAAKFAGSPEQGFQ